jgi:hypothetical protein
MHGFLYRLGTAIKDFGERRRWNFAIRLGLRIKGLVLNG